MYQYIFFRHYNTFSMCGKIMLTFGAILRAKSKSKQESINTIGKSEKISLRYTTATILQREQTVIKQGMTSSVRIPSYSMCH